MATLTEQRGLAAIEQAGGPDRARFALRDEACYPPAKGRIAETYRQLADGPMTGLELYEDLASRNWLLPQAGRPYRPHELRAHLRWMVGKGRLHVLTGASGSGAAASSRSAERGPNGLAFKVTYNDGGAYGGLIGYRDVCSDRIMVQNVEVDRRTWCRDPGNQCRRFCDAGRRGPRPQAPCYESELLTRKPFRFWTGRYHSGPRRGQAIPIKSDRVAVGDIVLLTTVAPERAEDERIVFACYRVGKVGTDERGHYVESDGSMELELPEDVAAACRYWDYQPPNRDGSVFWGSGLFRYLDAAVTRRFMSELVFRLGDRSERDIVVRAMGDAVDIERIPKATVGSGGSGGGEGEDHRRLKELVSAKPALVDLPAGSKATIEHSFLSGDRVDVLFDLPNGDSAVVEVETIVPLPGAHQAVKYRALLEVQRSEALGSGRVEAILVAHHFDAQTRELANRYGVRLVELKA